MREKRDKRVDLRKHNPFSMSMIIQILQTPSVGDRDMCNIMTLEYKCSIVVPPLL
jgi:hypothetical protein